MMYYQDMLPVADIGQNVSIVTGAGTVRYFEVIYVEGLPPSQDLIKDFGSLASGATSSANKIDAIAVEGSAKQSTDISEIGQYRIHIMDDFMLTLKEPAAQSRWKTRQSQIRADFNTIEYDPTLKSTEFYVYEDNVPYVDAYNPTNYTLSKTRAMFFGWRIIGVQLADKPDKYARIVATGFSR